MWERKGDLLPPFSEVKVEKSASTVREEALSRIAWALAAFIMAIVVAAIAWINNVSGFVAMAYLFTILLLMVAAVAIGFEAADRSGEGVNARFRAWAKTQPYLVEKDADMATIESKWRRQRREGAARHSPWEASREATTGSLSFCPSCGEPRSTERRLEIHRWALILRFVMTIGDE